MKKIITFLLIFAMIISCIPVMPAEAATKISLSTMYLEKGYSYKLTVNTKSKIKWTTSNKKIATVTQAGKVTGKNKGTTTIIATVGKKRYTSKIIVKRTKTGLAWSGLDRYYMSNYKPVKNTMKTIKGPFKTENVVVENHEGGSIYTIRKTYKTAKFYFGSSGKMAKSKRVKINEKCYYADSQGILEPYMTTAQMKEKILNDFNKSRKEDGLPAVVENPAMSKYAQIWSEQMADERKLYHSAFAKDGNGFPNYEAYYLTEEFNQLKEEFKQVNNIDEGESVAISSGEGCAYSTPRDFQYRRYRGMYEHVYSEFSHPGVQSIGIGVKVASDGKIYWTVNCYYFTR